MNLLLTTDSYKHSHYLQYPDGTTHIYSYIEPRKGDNPVVVFGIQELISQLAGGIWNTDIAEAEHICKAHGIPFNKEGWEALFEKYRGDLPLAIFGLPEGSVVDPSTPVLVMVNTDPEFPWLTSFFETLALRCIWYSSSVASNSRACKVAIKEGMIRTGADLGTLGFKMHDFGARGVSSTDSARIGGAAHLLNFLGTDTLEGIMYLRDSGYTNEVAGYSIPATEHSTVTSWGRSGEKDMYETFIRRNLGEGKIAACVSDSYNIWEALKMWHSLDPVLQEVGGTLVIRPDSGDPVDTPIMVIEKLMDLFGYTENDKGYKVLPDRIRVIQGDGITPETLQLIIDRMVQRKYSLDNIAFGMGGGLLQQVNRDTYGFAMKCSAAMVNGEWRDVYKDPINGKKTSKKGLVHPTGTLEDLDPTQLTPDSRIGNLVPYMINEWFADVDSLETLRARCEVMF